MTEVAQARRRPAPRTRRMADSAGLTGTDMLAPRPLLPSTGQQERISANPVSDGTPGEASTTALPQTVAPAAAPPEPEVAAEADAELAAPALEAPAPPQMEVTLLIPPAPENLESRSRGAARRATGGVQGAGTANRALPPAEEATAAARANVEEPETETRARAQGDLTAQLRERPQPSPEIEQLCADIQDAIENRRPVDEASLRQADPEADANEVGEDLRGDINADAGRVEGEYDQVDAPPEGSPAQLSAPIEQPPGSVDTPPVNAAAAAPAEVPAEDLSLDADLAATEGQVEAAGMTTEPAALITTGPVAEAREGVEGLEQTAAEDPAAVIAEQAEAVANSRAAMRDVEAQTLAALQASREGTVTDTLQGQIAAARTEEEKRAVASAAAEGIFTRAQDAVNTQLENMVGTAMDMWQTGKERIVGVFDRDLERAKAMVDERHEGVDGFFVSIWDDATGLPTAITNIYTRAERTFGRDICSLIREVSTYVNGIVIACEEIIDNADTEIQTLFDGLPAELQDWASQQQEGFQGRLDGLRDDVHTAQADFTQDLVNQAGNAVQEARERIDALREAAKGWVQKVADAVNAFLEDPVRAIINGLLMLVGIAPAAFWALLTRIEQVADDIAEDPMNFGNNLMEAIGQGFQNFFDNFFGHLLGGFVNWLFSAMGTVGVELPPDASVKSIITFFLQIMGLTWPNIREILVRHIGAENVELIEKAWELITLLIEEGPGGIFEMIKERLDPQAILNTVIEAAVSFMVEVIVAQATVRIIGLFNPVGAILQVIEAIYKVLKWIFENAARIFQLVESVVNGMADIIAGNITGFAQRVEQALAGMLVPVIDFVAGFLGLGNLPERIAEVVGGFQQVVLGAVDTAIGFLVERARGLLAALGIGGGEEERNQDGEVGDGELGERKSFSGGGESHSLWISEGGDTMVASTPTSLERLLNQWNGEVNTLATQTQPEARQLLSEVSAQNGIVLEEADEAKTAIARAESSPDDEQAQRAAEQEDTEVERLQGQMTPGLGRLFDIFEGGVPFNTITKAAAVGSTTLNITIEADGEELKPKLENEDFTRRLNAMVFGPLGQAHHQQGALLVQGIGQRTIAAVRAVEQLRLTDGKLLSPILEMVRQHADSLQTEVEKLLPTKATSINHLSRPPADRAVKYTITFNPSYTNSTILEEYDRQLRLQEEGINALLIDQWILNRNAYSLNTDILRDMDKEERRSLMNELNRRAEQAQSRARSTTVKYQRALDALREAMDKIDDESFRPSFSRIRAVTGRFGNERSWRRTNIGELANIATEMDDQIRNWSTVIASGRVAVLHNADQIAGGFGMIPEVVAVDPPTSTGDDHGPWLAYLRELSQYVGSSGVNSSIGSSWKTRIDPFEQSIRGQFDAEAWGIWQMNVELTRQ